MNVTPSYFVHRKIEEEYNQKKSLAAFIIPCLLVVFTWQLEILVTGFVKQEMKAQGKAYLDLQ